MFPIVEIVWIIYKHGGTVSSKIHPRYIKNYSTAKDKITTSGQIHLKFLKLKIKNEIKKYYNSNLDRRKPPYLYIDRQPDSQTASQTARQPARQPDRQPDSQPDSQLDSQTARQPARQSDRQPDSLPATQADRQPES